MKKGEDEQQTKKVGTGDRFLSPVFRARRQGAYSARTDVCDTGTVRGSEFLRKLQRLSRRRGVRYRYEPSLGKGSHGRVWIEMASTTLKDPKKELGPGLLRAMCRDLGIEPRDL
jgi:hypothetical protein